MLIWVLNQRPIPVGETIKFLKLPIFANIAQYDYIAYASPIDDRSAWGVSLIRFGVDDILNTMN
jgi:hypothetical protein